MTNDYVLFIHGVNNRDRRENPAYANQLIELLRNTIGDYSNLKTVPLYWGDVNQEAENNLLAKLKHEQGFWQQLWFRNFRETTILQFVGDGALYISRTVGSKVVDELNRQMVAQGLDGEHSQDRLHLVTHSWGTVILFDILFAARWQDESIPGHKSAMAIRKRFFGVDPDPEDGFRLASIHTLGSPIALFSLLDIVQGEALAKGQAELTAFQARRRATHDITPKLIQLLARLSEKIDDNKLPWRNFIHPGDPVAWPLNPLMYSLVDGFAKVVDLQDIITELNWFDYLMLPFSQTPLSLLINGGKAHGSYFTNTGVAKEIVRTIQQATRQTVL